VETIKRQTPVWSMVGWS